MKDTNRTLSFNKFINMFCSVSFGGFHLLQRKLYTISQISPVVPELRILLKGHQIYVMSNELMSAKYIPCDALSRYFNIVLSEYLLGILGNHY